jgi:hypothetical protein
MQKRVFMASMVLMQEMALEMGVLTNVISKEDNDMADNLSKEIELAFNDVNKSIRAFFMKDGDKTKFVKSKYAESLKVKMRRMHARGSFEELKGTISSLASKFELELKKHAGQSVHHDNGTTWKKTKTDSNRFAAMNKSMANILKIVS